MNQAYDVIVLGLGATGSSAVYHLSKTGLSVCGIDQYTPPHTLGSSHGQSRIIRQAYHENHFYVPFIKKAYELWDILAAEAGQTLLLRTGGLMLGNANSDMVKRAMRSADLYDIPYDYLQTNEIRQRFPVLNPPENTVGLLEHEAGILFPEACIKANLELAAQRGVTLKFNEKVAAITPGYDAVTISTANEKYSAKTLIVSAGPWMGELLPDLHLPLTVERQVLFWFNPESASSKALLSPDHLPIYIWEYEGNYMFYGFPDLGDGIKVALHHVGEPVSPDTINRKVSESEIASMQEIVNAYFNINPQFNYASTCMYTNTPDEHFIMDYHPKHKNIIIASPCSGHGFKFASVSGKILSDMVTRQVQELDISVFGLSRFLN